MEYQWDFSNKKTYNNRVGKYKFRKQIEFVLRNAENRFDNILDVAGGSGRFALPLYEYSKNIKVVDLDVEALNILSSRNNNIVTLQGDFIEVEITETFSLILCIEALGYFDDLDKFFAKINNLLSDQGRFVFMYNNPDSWRFLLRKIRHIRKGAHPYKEIKFDELKSILKKYSFDIVEMKGMNWLPLPLSSNSRLVWLFEFFEKWLGLSKWYSQSPWLLISIKKYQH
ncbi:MAG: class I SAM-dependent methyltransferase [Paludibacter sp.]|nr:class I SAM-dependent methyltransferase [Paludibacter sp.]